MVIQSQKFNGKNFANNEVFVDFKKKDVKFKPLKTRKGKDLSSLEAYAIVVDSIRFIYWKLGKIYFIYSFFVDYISNWIYTEIILVNFGIYFIFLLIVPQILALIFFNKKWRTDYYPKFNAIIHMIINNLRLKNTYKELVIDYSKIDKKFKFDFRNIMLDYKVTGDLANQLKKINIESLSSWDCSTWYAEFIFKQKAKDGQLIVKYI